MNNLALTFFGLTPYLGMGSIFDGWGLTRIDISIKQNFESVHPFTTVRES